MKRGSARGGFNSGSARRSEVDTTEDALILPISRLKTLPAYSRLRNALEADGGAIVELEILAGGGGYRVRPWVGTRTRYGVPGLSGEVQRAQWLSQDSMFIALAGTRPNYGGVRLWFVCPRSDCSRRCSVLYREQHTNARAFTCFRCARLVYVTQRLSPIDRAEDRSAKLAQRFEVSPDARNAFLKPKWMRWRTFDRIAGEIEAIDKRWRPVRTKNDEAWFIDGRSLDARHVAVGRFLRPLSLAGRFASRPVIREMASTAVRGTLTKRDGTGADLPRSQQEA